MAKTYAQLQAQIAALKAEAGQLMAAEVAAAVAKVKELVAAFNLTPRDVFGPKGVSAKRRKAPARAMDTPKYSDAEGHVWGDRGPRPQWLREALAAGHRLEEFAAGSSASSNGAPPTALPATQRGARRATKKAPPKPARTRRASAKKPAKTSRARKSAPPAAADSSSAEQG